MAQGVVAVTPTDLANSTYVDDFPPTDSVWETIDVTSIVASGAVGVILRVLTSSGAAEFAVRKKGSTDDPLPRDASVDWHYIVAGLDANLEFEFICEQWSTLVALELVGYVPSGAGFFFDNPIADNDVTPGSNNTWTGTDLAGFEQGADTIGIALFMVEETSNSARNAASVHPDDRASVPTDYIKVGRNAVWQMIAAAVKDNTTTRDVDLYATTSFSSIYLVGYIEAAFVGGNAMSDQSTGTTGSYQEADLTTLLGGDAGSVDGVFFIFVDSDSTNSSCWIRNNADTGDDRYGVGTSDAHRGVMGWVGIDSGDILEQQIEHASMDLWVVAWCKDGGTAGQTLTGGAINAAITVAGGSFSAGGASIVGAALSAPITVAAGALAVGGLSLDGGALAAPITVVAGALDPGGANLAGGATAAPITVVAGVFAAGGLSLVGSAVQAPITVAAGELLTATPQTLDGAAIAAPIVPTAGLFVPGGLSLVGNAIAAAMNVTAGSFALGGLSLLGSAIDGAITVVPGSLVPGGANIPGGAIPSAITVTGGTLEAGGGQTLVGNAVSTPIVVTAGAFALGGLALEGGAVQAILTVSGGAFAPGPASIAGGAVQAPITVRAGSFAPGGLSLQGNAGAAPITVAGGSLVPGPVFLVGAATQAILTVTGGVLAVGGVTLVGSALQAPITVLGGVLSGAVLPATKQVVIANALWRNSLDDAEWRRDLKSAHWRATIEGSRS